MTEIDWEEVKESFKTIIWDILVSLHTIAALLILLCLLVLMIAVTDLTYLLRHWNG